MKKWLLALLVIVIAFLLSVYVFIPSHLTISKITPLNCPQATAYRFIANSENWHSWWPKNERHNGSSSSAFSYRGDDYMITQKLLDAVVVSIHHKNQLLTTNLLLIPLKDDSLVAEWQCELSAGWNPVARFRRYNEAVQLKNNLAALLEHLQSFLQNRDSVYGIQIHKSSTIDTLLISAKYLSDHYPTTVEIYQYLQPLHDYLKQQGALETSVPMINVSRTPEHQFRTMVAIPTNKKLVQKGNLEAKIMINGSFMVTEVQGGDATVQKSLEQLQLFAADYKKTQMAIPFQYLVTDRIKEPDSTKWITRIYLPVYQ